MEWNEGNAVGARQNVRDELDIALSRVVLGVIDEMTGRLGGPPTYEEVSRIARRRGERGQARPEASLQGLLERFRPDDVRGMLEVLDARGLVRPDEARPNRATLTAPGRSMLRGVLPAPTGVVARVIERPEPDTDLYRQLRFLRSCLAKGLGVPAYHIFTDRSLRALAAREPRSLDELLRVPGIGAAKAARFGEDILACAARYGTRPPEDPAAPGAPGAPAALAASVGEPPPAWRVAPRPRPRPPRPIARRP